MPNKSSEKGYSLEKAVSLIQEAILQADPKLVGISFCIERNKIVQVAGVRHEIDVWVETHLNSHFKSVFIFECKNWQEPVGKNEIIVLSEKAKITGASRAFLVAREFTKDAKAQAELDRHLSLIKCDDQFVSPFDLQLYHAVYDPLHIEMAVTNWIVSGASPTPALDWKNQPCFFEKERVDFRRFIDHKMREMLGEYADRNPLMCAHHRNHYGEFLWQFPFRPGTFIVAETDIAILQLDVKFFANYHKLKLVSKFELKDQGRAFSFKLIDVPDEEISLEVDIVQRIQGNRANSQA